MSTITINGVEYEVTESGAGSVNQPVERDIAWLAIDNDTNKVIYCKNYNGQGTKFSSSLTGTRENYAATELAAKTLNDKITTNQTNISNCVTLDTHQTISGLKTFSAGVTESVGGYITLKRPTDNTTYPYAYDPVLKIEQNMFRVVTRYNGIPASFNFRFDEKAIVQDTRGYISVISGAIIPFAGTSAPAGYMLCNGVAISRTTYPDLFEAIGTTWGEGDGSTTFNIPDLRGYFLQGTNSMSDVGTTVSAGLPNIVGTFNPSIDGSNLIASNTTGAFAPYSAGSIVKILWSGTIEHDYGSVFKASNSNSIYGNSTTVQPPAKKINFLIKS